jgi:hypothetical protein
MPQGHHEIRTLSCEQADVLFSEAFSLLYNLLHENCTSKNLKRPQDITISRIRNLITDYEQEGKRRRQMEIDTQEA